MSNQLEMLEASCTRLVRRMVSLPRAISRAVDQGLDLMAVGGGRRSDRQFPPPNVPFHHHHHHPPGDQSIPNDLQPHLGFLSGFEQQFGIVHPFFYACRFEEALKMAEDEHKFVFVYLHSPNHPFTPHFCKNTLCSEVVVQFLDANFVSWGGIAEQGEGLHIATTLGPASFPFCAVVARDTGHSLVVVEQMEGPVTPEELVEILQTMLDKGSTIGNERAEAEEKRMADVRLRQEQDAAYYASLQVDQEKVSKPEKETHHQENATDNGQYSQILIRFPNGERKEKASSNVDKMEVIFKFIDALGLPGIGRNYKLVSSFPRKVYGADKMGLTLKDAGFYPEATLFIELL